MTLRRGSSVSKSDLTYDEKQKQKSDMSDSK